GLVETDGPRARPARARPSGRARPPGRRTREIELWGAAEGLLPDQPGDRGATVSGSYLEKLRALKSQKGILEAPSKPSNRSPSVAVAPTATAVGGFDGFEGTRSSRFSDFLGRYGRAVAALEAGCPDLIPPERWRQAVEDGRAFLARWGDQAEALGWSPRDLFGLHKPPAKPHPNYSRLSRYDETGLVWLLKGREVVALTEATVSIKGTTGNITIYRKHNKPAFGPLGDSRDDLQ